MAATAGIDELTYLTTDHLGTPILATTELGADVWSGGFEPFGEDWNGAEAAGVCLRLPGQWESAVWEEAGMGAEVYYNVHRWYEVGTGRYTRVDPLGRDGDAHLYLYARANSLRFFDLLGLKSRVCCRKIPFVGFFGFRHCYIEISTDKGSTTCGLFGGPGSGEPYGTGNIRHNASFDSGGECGDWNDGCEADQCVIGTARGYPNPSQYDFDRGPNSNTFAGTIARACDLKPPLVVGWRTPAWGDPPAGRRKGLHGMHPEPKPVKCRLP